ncbi:DUF3558 domain-containing protein [Rhodococcus rhodnii]|nr:DUF3558 family protein [Rhodococcus rhodnii]TXG92346.1 DUF3558 domain-containing protein [Rhodococcus rhodnii]
MTRRTRNRTAALLAVAAGSVWLTGCGSAPDEAEQTAAKWDTVDPCTLAQDDDLAPLLTQGLTDGEPVQGAGRTECTWGNLEQLNVVTVSLASAPGDDADTLRTVTVAGRTGSVLAESKYQCIVEFDSEDDGTLAIEAKFGLDAVATPDSSCDRVEPLAEQSLSRLAWNA